MPIDKEQSRHLLYEFDRLSDKLLRLTPRTFRNSVRDVLIGPALEEVRELIDRSRPPVLFVVGRKGAGKSTLIDALSRRPVGRDAEGKETQHYKIRYPHADASWEVYESGGIPDSGESPLTASEALADEIVAANPDVILHVIPADGVRSRTTDIALLQTVNETVSERLGHSVPMVNVLNRSDRLGKRGEWPPETHADKAKEIVVELDHLARQLLRTSRKPLERGMPAKGVTLEHDIHAGIIPVSADEDKLWNVNTLALFIGERLPRNAQLDYYQALDLRQGMRNVSSDIIQRFSTIATGIGATPIPMADIILLTPLQLLMIALIGALSGRPPSLRTAFQYMAAAGINVGIGMGIRTTARQVLKFVPIGGYVAAGAIAGTGTYALGKGAEAYFFAGEVNSLQALVDRYKSKFGISARHGLEVVEKDFPRASSRLARILPGLEAANDEDLPSSEQAPGKATRRTQRPSTTDADAVADAAVPARKATRKASTKKAATSKATTKKTAAPKKRAGKPAGKSESAPEKATRRKTAARPRTRKKPEPKQ